MKTILAQLSLCLFTAFLLSGCGGNKEKGSDSDDEKGIRALEQQTNLDGIINPVTDVDWYTINITEPGIVALNVYNDTQRYNVDILATIYEEDSNGTRKRIAADHFPEESATDSSLSINVNITEPKKLFIAIRDLDDNEASETETYSVSYDVAAPEDGNGTFDSATNLALNGSCSTDSIGTVGDTDVMRFNLSESGVYKISTDFNAFSGGTSVTLKVSLFDSEGTLVRSVAQSVDSVYRMVESLRAGSYYLLVNDHGKDNFDTSSSFTTCLTGVATEEISENDRQENATTISGSGHFEISGSLDYAGDQDWSSIQSGAAPISIQVLQFEFDPTASNGCDSWFLVEITDANGVVLFSKEYSTETGSRTAHVKVENSGEHFIAVSAIDEKVCSFGDKDGMRYQVSVDVIDVLDDIEMGEGNNTINHATELDETSDVSIEAKLSYVGDVDWYRITVPADAYQDRIVEIFIESESATPLEYYVSVFQADEILDTFTGWENNEYPVSFKTSYIISRTLGNTDTDYFVKIVDMQSDEADIDNNYTIRANIIPVQTQLAAVNDAKIINAVFFSEAEEQAQLAIDNNVVELVVSASDHRNFNYNAASFVITPELKDSLVTSSPVADTLEVTFPWQSGYIDYYKDRDWFQLDLSEIYVSAGGLADIWYCEIKIELYSPAPGSAVEYAWGLYRDSSNNYSVDDWQGEDGLYASNGDVSAGVAVLDIITPAADASGPMWVNNETASDRFYLAVADILNQSTNIADNDWGYDQPYFVRIALVYRSNLSKPEN
mgnify:CR=1 FL=1